MKKLHHILTQMKRLFREAAPQEKEFSLTQSVKTIQEDFFLQGELDIELFLEEKLMDHIHVPNIVLDQGKAAAMLLLTNDPLRLTSGTARSICRLAVGDGGATGSAYNIPKARDKTRTGLFYEVHRKDINSFTRPAAHQVTFLTDIDSSALSTADFNPAMGDTYLNEAGLVVSLPAIYTAGPPSGVGVIGPDDVLFSHTTFKSIPFQPILGVIGRFRWTLTAVL